MNSKLSATLAELNQEILGDAHLKAALELARRNDACFVTGSGNAGDGLIHHGAFSLLNGMNWSPRLASEWGLADEPERGWALMIGGAMIEGVWDERMRALRAFLDRGGHVIILPCTIFGFRELLSKYADQLMVFARERKTLENLRAAGVEHASMCHDLAFAVPPAFYLGLTKDEREGELSAYRTDEERSQADIPFRNLDLSLLWNGDVWRDAAKVEERCRLLGATLATFSTVSTDRLHIGIFAAALGCEVRLSSSIGDKIPGVFEYTLSRFSNVQFRPVPAADSPTDAWRPRDQLLDSLTELTKLRRDYFEPELDRLQKVVAEQDKVRVEWFAPELERRAQATQQLEAELERRAQAMQQLEAELERLGCSAQQMKSELARRLEAAQRLETQLSTASAQSAAAAAAAARQAEDLRRQVATHQRQSLFYARELAATVGELRTTREQRDELWQTKEDWHAPREIQLLAEVQRLEEERRRPPPIVNSSGWLQSLSRSLRMVGYLVFPFGKRRRAKRRRMLAALWLSK